MAGLAFCPEMLGAEEYGRDAFLRREGDLVILAIEIHGLKRTRSSVVRPLVLSGPGDRLSAFDEKGLLQRLHKTRLFKEISLTYARKGEGVVIGIHLQEKWTLIPLPLAVRNKNGQLYGLYLYEANLLGYNKKLFTGADYGDHGWRALFGFVDPKLGESSLTYSLFASTGRMIYEDAEIDRTVYRTYRARFLDLRYALGYELPRGLTPSVTGRYRQARVDQGYEDSRDNPESAESAAQGLRLVYRDLHYTLFYNRGMQITAEYLHGFPSGRYGFSYDQGTLKGRYSASPWRDHLVAVNGEGGWGRLPAVFEERIGGRPGFKTLSPQQINADRYASGSLEYEIPLGIFFWGVLTGVGFFEVGQYSRDDSPREPFYGPGGGIRAYLRSVAFPAFGFDYAWNARTGNTEFSVALGFYL